MAHSAETVAIHGDATSWAIPVCAPGRRTVARWLLIAGLVGAAWVASVMCGQERAHAATEVGTSPHLVRAEGSGAETRDARLRGEVAAGPTAAKPGRIAAADEVVGTVHLLASGLSQKVSAAADAVGGPLASGRSAATASAGLGGQPTVRLADHLLARVASILPSNGVTSGRGLGLSRVAGRLPAVVDRAVDTTRLVARRALAGSTATLPTVCSRTQVTAAQPVHRTTEHQRATHCAVREVLAVAPAASTMVDADWRLAGRTGHRGVQARLAGLHGHPRGRSLMCQPLVRPCATGPASTPAHVPAQSLPSPSFSGLVNVADRLLGDTPPLMVIMPRTPAVRPFARTVVDDRTFSPD